MSGEKLAYTYLYITLKPVLVSHRTLNLDDPIAQLPNLLIAVELQLKTHFRLL